MGAEVGPVLFFGVGAGRCGTMALANALACERGVLCTHEGKRREFERSGEQLLPFLTLQNRLAYEFPERAQALFDEARGSMDQIARASGATNFGDIAYNYAPFLDVMATRFPTSKLIVMFRSGIEFVRSATRQNGVDETPVGWAPRGKPLSAVERFVALGRIAPRSGTPLAARWDDVDHFARNAWLWAETNRLILAAMVRRAPGSTLVLRFEDFFADAPANYPRVRDFLALEGEPSEVALERLRKPINRRSEKVVGPAATWTSGDRATFAELAGAVMRDLDYPLP
jgi:hypothetical protein